MRLRRFATLLALAALALSSACGGGGGEEKKSVSTGMDKKLDARRLDAENFPRMTQHTAIPPAIMDTLRAKKRVYKVTRDEYWDEKGGVLANDYFEVWYPPGAATVTHGMYLLEQAMIARALLERELGGLPRGPVVMVGTADLDAYKRRTGREWWYYSEIKGDSIIFQPIYILVKRGLGEIATSHEYAQWVVRKLGGGHCPRWLEEGLASYFSGEKHILVGQLGEFKNEPLDMAPMQVEKILADEKERMYTRIAYYHAYKMVEKAIELFDNENVVSFVKQLGENGDLNESSRAVFGIGYEELLMHVSDYTIDSPAKKKSASQ